MSETLDRQSRDFQELTGEEGLAKIGALVKGIDIAMLATIDHQGLIRSRPMATQDEPFDGTLWFLTRNTSDKVHEIRQDESVTLDYADPAHSKYVTLRGRATVNKDRAKIKQLWNSMYKAWFPEGEDDPEIAVLRVDVSGGEFWEASSSKLVMGIRYVAAAVTGGVVSVGQSGHIAVR